MTMDYSAAEQRLIDSATGHYLVSSLCDRDEHEFYHIIYDKNDTPLFGATVRRARIPQEEKRAGEVIARFLLRRAWIPSGRREPPAYFTTAHPMIDELGRFLEASLSIGGTKTPEPRFDLRDERSVEGV